MPDGILSYNIDNYDQSYSTWLPYSGGLSANVWSIGGLYIDAAQNLTEQFDPGILDPARKWAEGRNSALQPGIHRRFRLLYSLLLVFKFQQS